MPTTSATQTNTTTAPASSTAPTPIGFLDGSTFNTSGTQIKVPVLTPDQISSTKPTTLPQPDTSVTSANAMVASAQNTPKSIDDYIKMLTPDTTSQNDYTAVNNRITELLGQQGNKGTDQITAEQNAGLPDMKKQLSDINASILTKMSDYNAANQALENTPQQIAAVVGSKQQQLQRTQAADIGMLNARAQALQGNITAAQDTVNRAIDLKYYSVENELQTKLQQLSTIKDQLSRDEAIRAKATELALQDQQRAIDAEKDKEKQINQVLLQAAGVGADQNTLNKIQKSGTVQDAIKNAGSFLSVEYRDKKKQQDFDNSIKLQNVSIDRAKLALEGAKIKAESASQQDVSQLVAYAQQYASNGNIPTGLPKNTFGIISQIAKELPKADGTLVDKNTGVKSSAIKPTQEDAILAAYNLKTNVIPELKKAYDNVNTGLLPGLFGSAGIKTQAMTHFEDVRTQFLNQLLLANSGKVVSDKELQRYQDLLPSSYSQAVGFGGSFNLFGRNGDTKLQDIEKGITDSLDSSLNTNGLSIYGYSKVKLQDGKSYNVGEILTNSKGQSARVNPDGSLSQVNQ